ncbi:MAG: hypothetical protein IJE12_11890 [Prevotella sp.]|nr:hypothetical protein [Prevotella sp.]
MVGIDVVAPRCGRSVVGCDLRSEDGFGGILADRCEDQLLCDIGRGLAADGHCARKAWFYLQKTASGGQGAEGSCFGERGNQGFCRAAGGWHLRGKQTSVASMPCPVVADIGGSTQRHLNPVESDGGTHVAAIGSGGRPRRLRGAAKLNNGSKQCGGTGKHRQRKKKKSDWFH